MNWYRVIAFLVGGAAILAVTAAPADSKPKPKPKTVAFTASYAGHVTEKVDGQNVTASATAKGTGTLVKSSSLAGVVQATTANPPCSPLSGPGTIKGAVGTLKLNLLSNSQACAAGEDDQNNIAVSGSAKVLGGTGTLKKAKGTLRFTGHYDRGTGDFTVKLAGKLTY